MRGGYLVIDARRKNNGYFDALKSLRKGLILVEGLQSLSEEFPVDSLTYYINNITDSVIVLEHPSEGDNLKVYPDGTIEVSTT